MKSLVGSSRHATSSSTPPPSGVTGSGSGSLSEPALELAQPAHTRLTIAILRHGSLMLRAGHSHSARGLRTLRSSLPHGPPWVEVIPGVDCVVVDNVTPPSRLSPERRLIAGRYELLNEIGRGGMGVVYRALDRELVEPVAVKVLARSLDRSMVARLRREVRLARRVTHRNVARIHDIGEDGGDWFLTMQLVEGETLRHELERRGALPRVEAIEMIAELCEGVAAAHAVGVLHLDLKPENIMRPPGGGVVVLDFGLARMAGDRTEPGTTVGTPPYMAPEQRSSREVDVRADLYAIGCLLFEVLVGKLRNDTGAPDADAVPDVSPSLRALLGSLVEFLPEKRPASARVVVDALHRELGFACGNPRARMAPQIRLAVLPFRGDDRELAAGITEELVDRLTALRGVSVLTTTAAIRFAGTDPVVAGAALGVDAVVEGALFAGDALYVTARLIDTARGEIGWSDRFEANANDILALHDRLALRIAEALRVELGTRPYRGVAAPAALAHYMRARGKLGQLDLEGVHGAIADLDRACALAPDLVPAIALRALACARAWFFANEADVDRDRTRALQAVSVARTRAVGYPETHLASGVLALQGGDLPRAIEEIDHVLELAPSHPVALEYSGRLLCEAGHGFEGFHQIELAAALDPRQWLGLLDKARHFALHRAWPEYEATIARLVERGAGDRAAMRSLRLRVAVWRHAPDDIERLARETLLHHPDRSLLCAYAEAQSGRRNAAAFDEVVDAHLTHHVPRRFACFARQLAAEVASRYDDPVRVLRQLELAATVELIDLEWLDLCPMLADVRQVTGFASVRRSVRARIAALWRS